MRTRCLRGCLCVLILVVGSSPAWAQGKKLAAKAKKPGAETKPLQIQLSDQGIPTVLQITSVKSDGSLQLCPAEMSDQSNPPVPLSDLKAGFYVGAVQEKLDSDLKEALFVRGQLTISESDDEWAGKLVVAKSAAKKIESGSVLLLFPTVDAKPADLKRAPEVARFVDGEIPKAADETEKAFIKAAGHLQFIGMALHQFHEQYHHFPPASLIGPDGKPWHSWRILVLPFVDQYELYNEYKWTEPWDGPNNKKLLDRMPDIYQDTTRGEAGDQFTKFVAITGEGLAFESGGAPFDGKTLNLVTSKGREIKSFPDRLSNTLIVAPVASDQKIPWTKPEDVIIDRDFPGLGKKGGFPLPYRSNNGAAGLFLRADGMVKAYLGNVNAEDFRSLLTIAGGESVDSDNLATFPLPEYPAFVPELAPTLGFEQAPQGESIVRLTMEPKVKPAVRKGPPPKPPKPPRI